MKVVSYSNKQKLKCLSKSKLTTKDIMVICDCGEVKANQIRKNFKKYVVQNDSYDDISIVFTEEFCEFLKLNVSRIEKFANLGY